MCPKASPPSTMPDNGCFWWNSTEAETETLRSCVRSITWCLALGAGYMKLFKHHSLKQRRWNCSDIRAFGFDDGNNEDGWMEEYGNLKTVGDDRITQKENKGWDTSPNNEAHFSGGL